MNNMGWPKHPTIKRAYLVNGTTLLPVSILTSMLYCEHQVYLEYIKGEKYELPKVMVDGSLKHDNLEDEFKKKAEIEMSIEEALFISQSENKAFLMRELFLFSVRYGIFGKIDELIITPNHITIVDDKSAKKMYESMKSQIFAYSLIFSDVIAPKRPIICSIRQIDSREYLWDTFFTNSERLKIIDKINDLHNKLKKGIGFTYPENTRKCEKCKFRSICGFFQMYKKQ